MELVGQASRPVGPPTSLAILSGAFNPPTRAHIALAHAALDVVDEVLFVLPRVFPHKPYTGASLEDRLRLLDAALSDEPRCSIAISERGLFIEIAHECREVYGAAVKLYVLCGRDAAERIASWDYGEPGAFLTQLETFDLIVAAREGEYNPPPEIRAHTRQILLAPEFQQISSTEVRRRIAAGEPWEHLVPAATVPLLHLDGSPSAPNNDN